MKGIEPSLPAWEAEVLPLNYTRLIRYNNTLHGLLFACFRAKFIRSDLSGRPESNRDRFGGIRAWAPG